MGDKMKEFIKIEDIKPHPKNPRDHSEEQIQKIAKSIAELDWGRPIIISHDNYILAGEGAYLAAKNVLKLKEVPFRRMKHVHDSCEAVAYMLADNKLGEESDWNYGKLQTINTDLKLANFDVMLTGFNETELQEIETKITDKTRIKEDNFNSSEKEVESTCKIGDIWQLGRHRLMCGDSTDNEDINKLLENELIDLIFTDPPYGQIAQDWDVKLNWNALSQLFNELLTPTGQIHIFCKLPFGNDIINRFTKIDFDFWQECIWEKPQFANFVEGRFQQNHENIYLFKRKKCRVKDMTTNLDLVMDEGEPYKLKGHGVSPINGMKRTDKVNETGERYPKTVMKYAAMQSSSERVGHPTQKPLKLCSKFILYGTSNKGKVFDPFGGSGTTLIACEQTERPCYMMELDPHYCDLIIKRWEEFTGQKSKQKKSN